MAAKNESAGGSGHIARAGVVVVVAAFVVAPPTFPFPSFWVFVVDVVRRLSRKLPIFSWNSLKSFSFIKAALANRSMVISTFVLLLSSLLLLYSRTSYSNKAHARFVSLSYFPKLPTGFLIFRTRREDLVASITAWGRGTASFSFASTWERMSRERPLTTEPRFGRGMIAGLYSSRYQGFCCGLFKRLR